MDMVRKFNNCRKIDKSLFFQGKSEGYPSENGLQLDADAALEFACHHPRFESGRNA